MGNVIQIKRGPGKPSNGTLANGELGFDTQNGYLYIGNSSKTTTAVKVEQANSATTLSTTLPISKGGTNATTVADIRKNLQFCQLLADQTFSSSKVSFDIDNYTEFSAFLVFWNYSGMRTSITIPSSMVSKTADYSYALTNYNSNGEPYTGAFIVRQKDDNTLTFKRYTGSKVDTGDITIRVYGLL